LLFPVISFSQQENSNIYRLIQEGKAYQKPVRYILFDQDSEKAEGDLQTISFIIGNEIFKHNKNLFKLDTLNIKEFDNIEFRSVNQLRDDEYHEHKMRTKEEGINMPPPFSHYNLKIFVVEKLNCKNYLRYEVEWVYAIP